MTHNPCTSTPHRRSRAHIEHLFMLMLVLVSLAILFACGGDDDQEDAFPCCNGGEYYSCPNKSAALVCDDSLDPATVCDFRPSKNDLCR